MSRVLSPPPEHVSTATPIAAEALAAHRPVSLKGPLASYADTIYPPRRDHALAPPMGCPPIICEYGALISDDGLRPRHEPHNGIDIGAAAGTEVIAAAAGRVLSAAIQTRGGCVIVLYHGADRHGHHVFSAYAHLSQFLALRGASVPRGAVIGLAGRSGEASVPHLHFTVFVDESDRCSLNADGTLFVTEHTIVSPHLFALTESVDGVIRWRAWRGEALDDGQSVYTGFTYPAPNTHS
jgi:murein DD-endopeptidase MepM/ murein hydrolase activator NlpD